MKKTIILYLLCLPVFFFFCKSLVYRAEHYVHSCLLFLFLILGPSIFDLFHMHKIEFPISN